MGRLKKYKRRFLIGLDKYQANTFVAMSNALGLSYSEVVSFLMTKYQLGENDHPGK